MNLDAPALAPVTLDEPQPHRPQLLHQSDALLIIDFQYDFLPGGPLAVPHSDELVAPIASLAASGRFATLVATQDWHPPGHSSFATTHGRAPFEKVALHGRPTVLWPTHCVQGTPGARLHEALPTEPLTVILRKGAQPSVDSYSAFRENLGPDGRRHVTGLGALLTSRGITRVFLCGLARDYCVLASAQDAAAEGFETYLIDDLTRAVDDASTAAVDEALGKAGVGLVYAKNLGRAS